MTLDANPVAIANELLYRLDRQAGITPRPRCGICGVYRDEPGHVIGSEDCFERRADLLAKSD